MKKTAKIGMLGLCLLLVSLPGFSQRNSFFFNLDYYSPAGDNIAAGYGTGLGTTIILTRTMVFSVEFKYGRYAVDKVEGGFLDGTLFITPVLGSLHYYFVPDALLSPYILAGIGIIFSNFRADERGSGAEVNITKQNVKDGLGFLGGLGADIQITERFKVYLEGYYLYRKTDVETSYLSGDTETFNVNLSHMGASIGIKYYF